MSGGEADPDPLEPLEQGVPGGSGEAVLRRGKGKPFFGGTRNKVAIDPLFL